MKKSFDQQLKIFLCHASFDKARVRDLHRRLQDDGYNPWLAIANLMAGREWEEDIANAIRSSHVVIICLSKKSFTRKGYIHKEIRFALDVASNNPPGTICVIPARMEKRVEVPDQLTRLQWVDLFEDDGYQKLVLALNARAESLKIAIRKRATETAGRKEKHPLIRFLHSHLLPPPGWHSPINGVLTEVGVALEQQLAPTRGYSRSRPASVTLDFEGKKGQRLKMLLDGAIYTTVLLQDIAVNASELFFVTSTPGLELTRYTASFKKTGLANDVVRLGKLLQRIRKDARVSRPQLYEFVNLRAGIFEDLWGKFSPLRNEIARYVVPLLAALQDALDWANEMLGRIGLLNVWTFELRNLDASRAAANHRKWNVLVEPELLREVLRNILYNVRHNFRGYALTPGTSWGDQVELRIKAERRLIPNRGSLDYVVIRTKSCGTPPSSDALRQATVNSTFAQQRLQVEEFGGSLFLKPAENEAGAVVELALLSRADVPLIAPPMKKGEMR